MSETDSNNNPPKRVATGVALPFPHGPMVAIAPVVLIGLILGWVYFTGTVQLKLGMRELNTENHEAKAIEYFNWAIASNPSMAEAFAQRAKARIAIERRKGMKADYSGAKSDTARAIKLAPANKDYFATSMEIEEAAHHFGNAMAGYSHLISLNVPHAARYLNRRARLAYILGYLEKARADRTKSAEISTAQIVSLNYEGEPPLENRAQQYVFLGETQKAIDDYGTCFKTDKNPRDLLHIGYLYENTNRPTQAIDTYSQLIQLFDKRDDVETAEALFRRANLYLKAGENEKALADADQLLKYQNNGAHHAFHARILDLLNRSAQAQAERKATISQLSFAVEDLYKDAPNDVLATNYVERAKFYAADHEWKKALKDYAIAITLYPEPSSYIGCARMYTKLGDYDKAIEFCGKAISPESQDNQRAQAYNLLAEIHLLQHKPELAVEDCAKAIAERDETGAGSYWRSKAYRQLGKNDLAKIDEQEALGLNYSAN